ncbi:hypothetical protein GWK47_013596 [Chionoecetes opilio]|uniref:Uncharacterized protein n=1 Tax=Chionoecetes opilio TaxID=41210 RepID=A0A8J4XXT2_CHIOP|nr:hypothetical protein GWK47_013596 [Chionoecetes opilio]
MSPTFCEKRCCNNAVGRLQAASVILKIRPLLQFFMSHLLFGSHVVKVSGIRDQEVDKTVDVSCQFLVQNTRTDRQVKHQTKKDSAGCKTQVANASGTTSLFHNEEEMLLLLWMKEVLCGMREQKMSWHRRNLIYHIGATCACRSPDNQLYQPKDSLLAELITGLRDIRMDKVLLKNVQRGWTEMTQRMRTLVMRGGCEVIKITLISK